MKRTTCWTVVWLCGFVLAAPAAATNPGSPDSAAAEDGLDRLVRAIVLQNAPHDYENTRQWGGTKRVWDGLHVSRDGLRIKTKRRWKEAKHGTWKRYRAWLIDPQRQFDVQFGNLHKTPDGKAAFDMVVDARLGAWGRLSEWRRDVQLFSLSADAEARVRLLLHCELAARLDHTRLPPDLVLEPAVRDAQLRLVDFRLHRISDADGPLVKQLGKGLQKVLEDEIEDRRGKLVERINRQIASHQDDLRLSAVDLATSGWRQVVELLRVGAAAE